METAEKPRPYWHVDLKWINAILLFFTLSASLLLFNLANLTQREHAIELSGTIVASLFSREGLDDAKGLEEFKQQANASPDGFIAPIPQFPNVRISKEQANTLSPRELRLAIFKQVTTPIYDKGLQGAAADITSNPDEQQKFVKDAALLGMFTRTTHETLQRAFIIFTVISVLLLAGVIYFSHGWGRLVSPGMLLLLTSPLGAFIGLMILYPPKDGDAPFAALPQIVTQAVGNSLAQSYGSALVLALILLAVAGIGKIVHGILRRSKQDTN